MRAADRCKEHFQGDRCGKAKNHALSVNENPDETHQGTFSVWEGEGDSKKLKGTTTNPYRTKRNRGVNRLLRAICSKNENPALMPQAERKTKSALLQLCLKAMRRG